MSDQGNEFVARTFTDTRKAALTLAKKELPQEASEYLTLVKNKLLRQTPEGEEQFSQLEQTIIEAWLDETEKLFVTPESRAKQRSLRHSIELLDSKVARQTSSKAILTQHLTDSEYANIVNQYAIRGETAPTRDEALVQRRGEQLDQIEGWMSYLLTGDGSRHHPEKWFRYYVLYNVLTKDKNGKTRTADTAMHFLGLHQGALARVHEELLDLTYATEGETKQGKQKRLEAFQQYNFHERYNHFVSEVERRQKEGGSHEEGWVPFTDPQKLAEASATTPWCLAGLPTARRYLTDRGVVHVYFEEGQPKVGVYVKDGEIREVRGADDRQNLDPQFSVVLQEFLDQYPNVSVYKLQAEHARMLALIETKVSFGMQDLNKEELEFLYEIHGPLAYFGYEKPQALEDIRASRRGQLLEDMCVVFECRPQQIARTPKEINQSTRAYVGNEFPERRLLNILLRNAPNNIYVGGFPEGKNPINILPTGGKTADEYRRAPESHNINQASWAISMFQNPEFEKRIPQEARDERIIEVRVRQFMREGETYLDTKTFYKRVKKALGKDCLCPPTMAVDYLLAFGQEFPMDKWLYIGMEPIADSDDDPSVFELNRSEDGLWVDGDTALDGYQWDPGSKFVFRLPQERKETI